MLVPAAVEGREGRASSGTRGDGLIASGAGGKPPQALWGRTVLYSRLHCSTSTAASANEQKISPFNSSSLSLPLKPASAGCTIRR